jgi:hypothetical protein
MSWTLDRLLGVKTATAPKGGFMMQPASTCKCQASESRVMDMWWKYTALFAMRTPRFPKILRVEAQAEVTASLEGIFGARQIGPIRLRKRGSP